MTLATTVSARARCAEPQFLAVVDGAFARPGGPAQKRMEQVVCPGCPIWEQCLRDALDNGEHGPWGGTNERLRRRTVRRPFTHNLQLDPRTARPKVERTQTAGQLRANNIALARHGIAAADVKSWALATGRATKVPRGTPSLALIEAYASEHTTTRRHTA